MFRHQFDSRRVEPPGRLVAPVLLAAKGRTNWFRAVRYSSSRSWVKTSGKAPPMLRRPVHAQGPGVCSAFQTWVILPSSTRNVSMLDMVKTLPSLAVPVIS